MQSKRDYLISKGLAKPGRGKFSNAGKAALAEAEASGMKFSDSGPAIPTKAKPTGNPTESSAGGQSAQKTEQPWSSLLTPDDYRFPEKEYRGVQFVNGKKREVSLREVCNTCRVSLVNHMCENPTVLGDIVVKIERR